MQNRTRFAAGRALDVVCLGRFAVDFYAQQIGARLEDVTSFAKYLGGSSANTAFGCARLGLKTGLVSRIGDDALGHFLVETIAREGCDVSHVGVDPTRLTGAVVLGIKDRETFPLIFLRENCADMAIDEAEIEEAYIASSRALLITGTHFSAAHVDRISNLALDRARANDVRTVLDIDYRPVLWGLTKRGDGETRFIRSEGVTAHLQRILPKFDLVIGTTEEFAIAGGSQDIIEALRRVRALTTATLVVKRGPMGCAVIDGAIPASLDDAFNGRGVTVEVLNVLGAGDAFSAGFLSGWVRGEDYGACTRYANACGALVVSRHGCAPAMPTRIELDHFLAHAAAIPRPDQDATLNRLHRVTAPRAPRDELFVFAFDHRNQFFALAQETGAGEARLPRLKQLFVDAVRETEEARSLGGRVGILCDDRYGQDALNAATGRGWWIGRPVELPGSNPLVFDRGRSVGTTLIPWPAEHVAKCLVLFHPDDAIEARLENEAQIGALHEAVQASGHALMLEIIPPRSLAQAPDLVYRAMKRLYNLGIYPEWWKLAPMPPVQWQAVDALIAERDPYCRGVLLLGLNAPISTLAEGFRDAAASRTVRGFAVGRTIFHAPARAWLAGEIDDAGVKAHVRTTYEGLIDAWRQVRASRAKAGGMSSVRLTMAQALVRYLAALRVESPGGERLFAGVWAIFGHGNVAGVGEALYAARNELPTLRAHNEQAMAHAAIGFAKASFRRRMMACTTSIGPGATNLVTAAAVAHVNRLPVLLLPGDVFVTREPDPVLQQVEDFCDGTSSANDCLRPVSRYFDRIMHPAQLLTALPRAIHALTDPALCGPVTLALPQDVQTMAWDYPEAFLAPAPVRFAAPLAEPGALEAMTQAIRAARRPLIVAGGGVLYAGASEALRTFADRHGVPVAETQAGKGALPWDHPLAAGSIGVTGAAAANALARDADLVLAIGTRLQDFTTGSHALFPDARLAAINVNAIDAGKRRAVAMVADAGRGLEALDAALGAWASDAAWRTRAVDESRRWREAVARVTALSKTSLPSDAQVIGAVQRSGVDSASSDIVVCAAGSLPGELHKLWRTAAPGGYHVEYGYSCMGYEIAGALGVKLAQPEREVVAMLGDGSYLMMNSEIATSVMLGAKLVIVVLDNGGFGCIHRLQQAVGGAPFNNLLKDTGRGSNAAPAIDFAAHAASMGAQAENVDTLDGLDAALERARRADRTAVVCIRTDPDRSTADGGTWWEVAVPEVSERAEVRAARERYEVGKQGQRP